jgi:RNA polymerase sigma-70 factor (ECF subfamily)
VDTDDEQLAARARDGDRRAFTELVGRHQQAVFGYARRMLRDPDLADDATQEAFIAAYRAIAGFQGGSFRSWLLRIVHNKGLDLVRARGRRAVVSLDTGDAPDVPDRTSPSPAAWLERAGLNQLIEQAFGQLSAEQRAAVVLRDIEGLRYDEISRVLGVDLGTVKSRIARGRGRLRRLLLKDRELLPADLRLPNGGSNDG